MSNLLVPKKYFFLALIFCLQSISAQTIYLHCGNLFDSTSGRMLKKQTVIVDGNEIKQVEMGYTYPTDSAIEVIDLSEKTVYPGFIDLHVHVESETTKNSYLDTYEKNPEDIALDGVVYAEKTLMAGFTTVRDVGGSGVNIALS